jgi:hypothetical protein
VETYSAVFCQNCELVEISSGILFYSIYLFIYLFFNEGIVEFVGLNFGHTFYVDLIVSVSMKLLFGPHNSHAAVHMLYPKILIMCILILSSLAVLLACIDLACQSRSG